jgi:hypothetical protein
MIAPLPTLAWHAAKSIRWCATSQGRDCATTRPTGSSDGLFVGARPLSHATLPRRAGRASMSRTSLPRIGASVSSSTVVSCRSRAPLARPVSIRHRQGGCQTLGRARLRDHLPGVARFGVIPKAPAARHRWSSAHLRAAALSAGQTDELDWARLRLGARARRSATPSSGPHSLSGECYCPSGPQLRSDGGLARPRAAPLRAAPHEHTWVACGRQKSIA